MREGQYKKLKQLLHGKSNCGEEFLVYEYDTGNYPKGPIIGPVRFLKRRLNKWNRIGIPRKLRPYSSYGYEMDNNTRCGKIKRLILSASPSTSFYRATIYDFTNEYFKGDGARVYKLHRKGE